jgi:TonB family protein
MKTKWIVLLLALAAGGLPAPASAAAGAGDEDAGFELTFSHYVEPLFPQSIKYDGITEGFAEIVVDINEDGTIADWLPIKTNHPQFVRTIEYVIDEWRFNPPLKDGQPIPVVQRFTFNFSHEGIVLISGNLNEAYLGRLTREFALYRMVVGIKELDGIPEPVEIVRPLINPEIPEGERAGSVVVKFFIDKQGKVRIPVVKEINGHRGLAESAYIAIQQWKFKPPTLHGQPVAAEVQQPFFFKETPTPQPQVRD